MQLLRVDQRAYELLVPAARQLTAAGCRLVEVVEHRERYGGGNWLEAKVVWRHEYHQLDTGPLAYESWTENVVAMASRLYVLAAQLRTKNA